MSKSIFWARSIITGALIVGIFYHFHWTLGSFCIMMWSGVEVCCSAINSNRRVIESVYEHTKHHCELINNHGDWIKGNDERLKKHNQMTAKMLQEVASIKKSVLDAINRVR